MPVKTSARKPNYLKRIELDAGLRRHDQLSVKNNESMMNE